MIIRIIFFLCLASSISCQSNESVSDDNNYAITEFHFEKNMAGPIKQIKLKSYLSDRKFNKVKPGNQYSWRLDYIRNFSLDGTLIVDQKIDYDGNLSGTRVQKFRADGIRLMDSSKTKYIVYKYNKDDFLVYKGNPYSHEIHNYNGHYLISKLYIEDKDTVGIGQIMAKSDTIYEFGLSGIDTVGLTISIENEYQFPTHIELYDKEGLMELTQTEYDGETLQPTKELWKSYEGGKVSGSIMTEYINGDEVKITESGENGSIDFVEVISYDYDNYGNWTVKRVNHGDSKYYLVLRNITYY